MSVRTKVAFYDRPAFEYVNKYVTEDSLTYLDDSEVFAFTGMYTMRGIIAPYKWTAIALHNRRGVYSRLQRQQLRLWMHWRSSRYHRWSRTEWRCRSSTAPVRSHTDRTACEIKSL